MNFSFFSSLTKADASEFLSAFVRSEKAATCAMVDVARQHGIDADFTLASLPDVVLWSVRHVQTIKMSPDTLLPTWITATDAYQRGLFQFTDESKPMVLRVAYYFGECFVRRFQRLRWSIGDEETAQQNMPVVTGFGRQIELAPILVTENLFRRSISEVDSSDTVRRTVDYWAACAELN
jgi:hypothetical protein